MLAKSTKRWGTSCVALGRCSSSTLVCRGILLLCGLVASCSRTSVSGQCSAGRPGGLQVAWAALWARGTSGCRDPLPPAHLIPSLTWPSPRANIGRCWLPSAFLDTGVGPGKKQPGREWDAGIASCGLTCWTTMPARESGMLCVPRYSTEILFFNSFIYLKGRMREIFIPLDYFPNL